MGAFFEAIGRFFAPILKAIFPNLLQDAKDPTEVRSAGYDEELVDDFDKGLEEDLEDDDYDFMSGDVHKGPKDQPR